MQTTQVSSQDAYVGLSLSILQEVFTNYHPRDFAVRFWDGTDVAAGAGSERSFHDGPASIPALYERCFCA